MCLAYNLQYVLEDNNNAKYYSSRLFFIFYFFLPQVVNTNTTTTLFIIYISYSMNACRIESNKDYYYSEIYLRRTRRVPVKQLQYYYNTLIYQLIKNSNCVYEI